MNILSLVQTALELGLICSLTVLALFLSYSMLNVCDLSTDGCFTLGAAVGAMVAIAGHPYLAILAAMGAGVLSGFITALLITVLQFGCQAASTTYSSIDANFADLIQGIILFAVLAADFFTRFRLARRAAAPKEVSK